jgi:hypothetical protein
MTLREKHTVRVFENRVLRRIFDRKGIKEEEVGDNCLTRSMKSWRMRWAGHSARTGNKRDACSVFVGKLEGKRPLGRLRRRWENYIKTIFR